MANACNAAPNGANMEPQTTPQPLDLVATLIAELRRIAAEPPRVERLAYSIDETAAALGRSRRVVEGLIDSGELKTRRVGRQLAISRAELERFLAAR